jgi:O-antigen/teichoic acid export membrane protein
LTLSFQIRRLARHSAIYGLGGILSRLLAVFLLPLYTSYLGTKGFGKIETITALSTVLVIVLSAGISSAFFRFYFDSQDPERRVLVVRTAFWFTMGMATAGLVLGCLLATPLAHLLKLGDDPWLVRAGAVGLWAQMNYAQLTNLFRVEERSVQFVIASVANILITVGVTVLLVVGLHKGPTGAVVGNFVGTLAVYLVLVGYRRYQLGWQFDRGLLRDMNRFGLPLVPSALALWAINFIDRFFVAVYKGQGEVGVYSLAVRASSVIVFLMIAFRLAWPAFAYSIDDDSSARRTYSYVLTYLLFVCCWISLALGALAPWIVKVLAPTKPEFHRADEAVGLLAFASTAYAGYTVLAIGIGRARQTQFNWIVSGAAAALNIGLNFALIPRYGMMGAAVSTAAAYVGLFAGMTLNSQRVYPVPYQWRRVLTLSAVAVALAAIGYELRSLPVSIALFVAYPLLLLPLGFYLPAERARLRRLVPLRS